MKSHLRILNIRKRLHSRHNHKTSLTIQVSPKIQGSLDSRILDAMDLWLVTQRKTLESTVQSRLVRWLLRMVFEYYGFACRSHCDCDGKCYASIEYRGVFSDEGEARHAANCNGGAYKPIPFNTPLPEETVRYKAGDVPQSEASPWYRRGVDLPFEAVPRETRERLRALESRFDEVDADFQGECPTATSRAV